MTSAVFSWGSIGFLIWMDWRNKVVLRCSNTSISSNDFYFP